MIFSVNTRLRNKVITDCGLPRSLSVKLLAIVYKNSFLKEKIEFT